MIRLKNINKFFGSHQALKDINLTVSKGEVVVVLGPSGSGKSTLLRCINYLERPSSGIIEVGKLRVDAATADRKNIIALRAATGMVFQQFHLFKNMNVLRNVTLGLTTVKKIKKDEAEKKGKDLLEKVGLSDRMYYYPSCLSGGQQQRAAIARALAMNPDTLLLDEPTSALDPELIAEVLLTIKTIAKENNTMIIVTHELNFAREVADKIVFLDDGVIVEQGKTEEIFTNPKEERTKQFLGKAFSTFVYEI